MIDEHADTADLTMNGKLDQILAELADLKAWRAQVSALLEDRARETRPKLDLILKELSDMRENDRDMVARLDRIESRLETLAMVVMDVRGAQRRLGDRVGEIERRPN